MGVPFGSFSVDGAFAQAVVLSTATRAKEASRQAGALLMGDFLA
jgi:hypothetical protein